MKLRLIAAAVAALTVVSVPSTFAAAKTMKAHKATMAGKKMTGKKMAGKKMAGKKMAGKKMAGKKMMSMKKK